MDATEITRFLNPLLNVILGILKYGVSKWYSFFTHIHCTFKFKIYLCIFL